MPISQPSTKYLPFVLMAYLTFMLADQILLYRTVQLGIFYLVCGVFIMPFYYFIGDLIAEVYGFRMAKKAIWSMVVCTIIFAMIVSVLNMLPVPVGWAHKQDYDVVIGHLLRGAVGGAAIAVVGGSYINAFLVSKLKILTHGRYFWLRSIASTALGEGIQMILGCLLLFVGVMPFHQVLILMLDLYIWQIGMGILISFPMVIIANLLKKAEGDYVELSIDFNPFKKQGKDEQEPSLPSNPDIPTN